MNLTPTGGPNPLAGQAQPSGTQNPPASSLRVENIDINDACIFQHRSDMHIYEVSSEKIDQIRSAASSGSDELALGTFLISTGISAIITLLTTEIKNPSVHIGFWAAAFLGLPVGLLFVLKWLRSKKAVPAILDGILGAPARSRRSIT